MVTPNIQFKSVLNFLVIFKMYFKARLQNNDVKGSAYYFIVRELLSFYLLSRVLCKQ
jgi:hypothetical protein